MTTNQGDVVLLVDDAPDTLGALCQELENAGCTVLVAGDGESALRQMDLASPDAVLLDARMPGLDGFETCRRMRQEPAWAHVPVIFMTGLDDAEHVVAGFAAGGVDYVVKPVRSAEVLARLSTHLRNARSARLAREALDLGGSGLAIVDDRGRLAWQSPRARDGLGAAFAGSVADAGLWLHQAHGSGAAERRLADGRCLHARALGAAGFGETTWLIRVDAGPSPTAAPSTARSRLDDARLTPREAEVLSWVAKGKTNRDVGEILGMSPRTVNKHLEHVFEKLGVETRSAAAALVGRSLAHPDEA